MLSLEGFYNLIGLHDKATVLAYSFRITSSTIVAWYSFHRCLFRCYSSYLSLHQPYNINVDLSITSTCNAIQHSLHLALTPDTSSVNCLNMCLQITERYSVCRCLYYRHSIDPCQRYGQRGHSATEKTVLVGYACPDHSSRRKKDDEEKQSSSGRHWRDSGYSSGGYQSSAGRHR